jgi:diaminopimelate decarboxylase
VFARDRDLPPLEVGDLVAILDTGAYGAVMASNYNRRLLAPEVLVDHGSWTIIRRRQTLDDVLALES